jgi:uncharacterized Rmd1/YagE family protein
MTKRKSYIVEAYYIGESIELKRLDEFLKRFPVLNRDHPIVVQFKNDSFVAITKFGVVVFWNVSENERRQFILDLMPYTKAIRPTYPYWDSIEVFVGTEDKISAKGVVISILEVERIKLVSYALSQSVALERYEEEIDSSLSELDFIINNLKTTGRAKLNERALLKQVGRALSIKQIAILHLALFDKPESTWESQELEKLYADLETEFDLQTRFSVLDKKIEFLSENSKMLMDFLAEKRNAFLELIIIILILIEVIPFVLEIFGKFLRKL